MPSSQPETSDSREEHDSSNCDTKPAKMLKVHIFVHNKPWDSVTINNTSAMDTSQSSNEDNGTKHDSIQDSENGILYDLEEMEQGFLLISVSPKRKKQVGQLKVRTFNLDAHFMAYLLKTLQLSPAYRNAFITNLFASDVDMPALCVKVQWPKKCGIDFRWNEIVMTSVLQRCELVNAMSYLSTLGGGFSSLGDQSLECAKTAGQISFRQLRIAFTLGDPLLAARCYLYVALSLMQRGYYKDAKRIIKREYYAAKPVDPVLVRMCLGSWAKLQYLWKKYKTCCNKKNC